MKLEGGEWLVLKILGDLQGDSTDYVDDARLAAATKMIVEDVRDWLETLEGKNGKGGVRLGFLLSPFEGGVSDLPRRLRIQFEGTIYRVMASASPSPTGRRTSANHGTDRAGNRKTKSDTQTSPVGGGFSL